MARTMKNWLLPIALMAASACTKDHLVYIYPDGGATTNTDGGVQDSGFTFNADGMACATQSSKAAIAPLDILLILDTSASMDYLGKWTSVKQAVRSFINNPAALGLGLGVQFYPLRAQCNVSDYADPAVPIQVLPAGVSDIQASLEIQQMSGGTPMVAALEGAFDYLQQWSLANPTHKVALVLATDGTPDDSCIAPPMTGLPNSLANATITAMNAYTGTPSVSTFVIGVGEDTMQLQSIADAGGGIALFVDTNSDIQGAFLSALNQIRGNALSCQFEIPPSTTGQALDFQLVNVVYTPSNGNPPVALVNVGSASQCTLAPDNGWYYDNPTTPTKVVLCQDSCSIASSDIAGRVDVVYGCASNIL